MGPPRRASSHSSSDLLDERVTDPFMDDRATLPDIPSGPEPIRDLDNVASDVAVRMARREIESALASFASGDPMAAVEAYDAALEKFPGDAVATYNRGVALWAMGQQATALLDFAKAAELAPRMAEAHLGIAMGLHERGDVAKAKELAAVARSLFEERGDKGSAFAAARYLSMRPTP